MKTIVISECGHAYRVFKRLAPTWFSDFNFKVKSIIELVADYVKEGRLEIRNKVVKEPITYHDPCQLARNGGVVEEPRKLLRLVAENYRELTPSREKNWCCGSGGGLVAIPELYELRMKAGKVKAEQIKRAGARIMATACENCKLKITGVIDLVAEAI